MSWEWAALTPHPPIIVPEVGQGREREAAATVAGVERLLGRLKGTARPDCLLLLSPHQPYAPGSLFLNSAPRLRGSFAPFGAPSVAFDVSTPPDALAALTEHLKPDIPLRAGGAEDLTRDQGSLVPLYYLSKVWPELPPVILASPIGLDPDGALRLGRALSRLPGEGRWALLASGDLSHRLKPDAPAGYSPAGAEFDRAAVRALETGDPGILTALPPAKIDGAGECGMRSLLALLGLCKGLGAALDVLSYEGPFGVGYCNAVWVRE